MNWLARLGGGPWDLNVEKLSRLFDFTRGGRLSVGFITIAGLTEADRSHTEGLNERK